MIADIKKELRKKAFEKRATLSPDQAEKAAKAIAAHGLAFLDILDCKVIAGFYPKGDEINCLPLLAKLEAQGHRLVLPVISAKSKPLFFREWKGGSALERGVFDVFIPPSSAKELEPDILLVPLLAFDDAGFRLGYGGGFYDRTLNCLRQSKDIIAVGLAYDEQKMETVPRDLTDQPVDWMLTPSGACKID